MLALAESESKVATLASTAASEKALHASALNKVEKELQKSKDKLLTEEEKILNLID